jgi:hypothetical protein
VRARILLVAALATVSCSCADDGTDAASATSTSAAPTTTEPASVTARHSCGPGDWPTIEVDVEGSASEPLTAELVIDGRVVGRSTDALLAIRLDEVPSADRALLYEDNAATAVRVRHSRSGVIAETTEIAPRRGGCG